MDRSLLAPSDLVVIGGYFLLSAIAKMTIAVGLLLAIAGAMVGDVSARASDLGVALALIALGTIQYRRSRVSRSDTDVERAVAAAGHHARKSSTNSPTS